MGDTYPLETYQQIIFGVQFRISKKNLILMKKIDKNQQKLFQKHKNPAKRTKKQVACIIYKYKFAYKVLSRKWRGNRSQRDVNSKNEKTLSKGGKRWKMTRKIEKWSFRK